MVIVLSWAAAARRQFVDLGLGAGDALARKEDSATGEVALQARGRLHVNAQYYRISQVVSGVCSGRVRGEAARAGSKPAEVAEIRDKRGCLLSEVRYLHGSHAAPAGIDL